MVNYIYVEKDDITKWAVEEKFVSEAEANNFYSALEKRADGRNASNFINLLYYLGGAIIFGSMAYFTTLIFQLSLLIFSIMDFVYVIVCFYLALSYWSSKNTQTVGGVLAVVSVMLFPIGIQAILKYYNLNITSYPGIEGEIGLILFSAAAIYKIRFPFLSMPLYLGFYCLQFTLLVGICGPNYSAFTFKYITLAYGLVMLGISLKISSIPNWGANFSWWGYVFSSCLIAGAANSLLWRNNGSIPFFFNGLVYLIFNALFMLISIKLNVTIFLIWGAWGVFFYLSYLSYTYFSGSYLFPVILALIGFLIIKIAIYISSVSKSIAQSKLLKSKVEEENENENANFEEQENFIPMQQQPPQQQPVIVYYPYFGVNTSN